MPSPLPTLASTLLTQLPLWGAIAVILLAAALLARWFRGMGLAGGALLAGLIVGVAVGPGVLGRAVPALSTPIFEGDSAALERRIAAQRAVVALSLATGSAGPSVDTTVVEREVRDELAQAEDAWQRARAAHREPLHVVLLLLAAIVLVASGGATAVRAPCRSYQRLEAVLVALWCATIAYAFTLAVMWLWGHGPLSPTTLITAAAVVCGSFALRPADRRIARRVTLDGAALVEQSGRIATLIACGMISVALLRSEQGSGVVVALLLPWCPLIGWIVRAARPAWLVRIAEHVALPGLVAVTLLFVDPFQHIAIGFTILAYILFEDARGLGAWLGHWTSGRASPAGALQLALAGLGVEPMVAVIAAIGVASNVLPPWIAASLILGATGLGLLTNARRALADRFAGRLPATAAPH